MKNYLFLISFLSMLTTLSCSQDDPVEEDIRKEVKVTATFNSLSSSDNIRTVGNSWETGDEIGLFMKSVNTNLSQDALAYNVKYTFANGNTFINSTNNKVYYPFNNEKVNLISYYPYRELLNGFSYEVNIANQSDLSAIDLMYSNNLNSVNSTNESVNFEFEHQLTKVILIINSGDTGKELTDLNVRITNINTKASFSLVDGSMCDEDVLDDVFFNIDINKSKAQAILLPDDDLTDNTLVVTINGTLYLYDLSESNPEKSFEKSKKYVFNLTLRGCQVIDLDGLTATIKDWGETIPEDVFADEIPISGGDEGTAPDPGEGEIDPKPDTGEEDSATDPVDGDGSLEEPYTISQAMNLSPRKGVWIKGYIIGGYDSGSLKNLTSDVSIATDQSVALAEIQSESLLENTLPVDFSVGNLDQPFRGELNFKDNADKIGRSVLLMGDIAPCGYAPQRTGLINIKNTYID